MDVYVNTKILNLMIIIIHEADELNLSFRDGATHHFVLEFFDFVLKYEMR